MDWQGELVAGLASTLRGFRNGSFYGTKIRAPHAFVMTLLFRKGSLRDKLNSIMALTFEHTKNLASFVLIYKAALTLGRLTWSALGLKRDPRLGHPAVGWHAFVAGCLGGYFVWGKRTSVNYQIVLYLISRILVAIIKSLAVKGIAPFCHFTERQTFPWLATIVWGTILYLFEMEGPSVHKSLKSSMDFLYHDANSWQTVTDFLPSIATVVVLVYHQFFSTPRAPRPPSA